MPRILITGNGFDLHRNLPTTYNDFIKITSYLTSNEGCSFSFNTIYGCSDSYDRIKENFKDDIIFNEQNIKLIREIANKNLLFVFFKSEFEIETWIDFENKIEYLLKNIFYSIKLLRETSFQKGSINSNRGYSYNTYLNNNYTFIQILSILKVIEIGSQEFNWNSKFLIEKYGRNIDIDEQKILNIVYDELLEFRKLFNLYLQTFINPLYLNIKNSIQLSHIFDNIDFYFTFNYTPTIEKIHKVRNIKVNYLHGKSEENNENIVFGISELFEEDCKKANYIKFTKYFQKFNNRTDYYFLNKLSLEEDDNFVFYFWGHSLDKSDSTYINEVFDFISNIKGKIKRIVIVYHNEKSRSNCLLNLFSIRGKEDVELKIRNNQLLFYQTNSKELTLDLTESLESVPPSFLF